MRVAVVEERAREPVNTKLRIVLEHGYHTLRCTAENQVQSVDSVGAEIVQCTATGCWVVANVRRIEELLCQHRMCAANWADRLGGYELTELVPLRMVAIAERLLDVLSGAIAGFA